MPPLSEFPKPPVLYSFRRCPYAMRARMTLAYCGIDWEHREVLLKDKPAAMLALSPKGTVPVLLLATDPTNSDPDSCGAEPIVIDESIEIMHWALDQHDPAGWRSMPAEQRIAADSMVEGMEQTFKPNLDGYKYSNALTSPQRLQHRAACEQQLARYDKLLSQQSFLLTPTLSFVDVALFPFVRQFANVDRNWFDALSYPNLQRWLENLLQADLFLSIMTKHPQWQSG